MQCPHFNVENSQPVCSQMEAEGMDGKISDFDVQHYCNGNPSNCYYFRNSYKVIGESLAEIEQNTGTHDFTTA